MHAHNIRHYAFYWCLVKVTFAPNLAKKLSSIFYDLILLFQLSVANRESFKEFKAREVLKIKKEKTGIYLKGRK